MKTNIGHTRRRRPGSPASIKTVLALRARHAAADAALRTRQPGASTSRPRPFCVNSEAARRGPTGHARAGVSSFGIGGTNAHVVVGRAPEAAAPPVRAARLVVSARDEAALADLMAGYRAMLAEQPSSFAAVAGAASRRARLPVWVSADTAEALAYAEPQRGSPGTVAPEAAATGEGPPLDVPLYPFQRSRHWVDAEVPLLGPPVATPFGETFRQVELTPALLAVLRQHRVAEAGADDAPATLLPAALHLALFAAIGPVADIAIERPLTWEAAPDLQLWQSVDGGLRVMTQRNGTWECLATARVAPVALLGDVWETKRVPGSTARPGPRRWHDRGSSSAPRSGRSHGCSAVVPECRPNSSPTQ